MNLEMERGGMLDMLDDAHSGRCLRYDASDNTLEEKSIFVIEYAEARWEKELEVQEPAVAIVAVTIHKVRDRREVVEVKRPGKPRIT